MSSITLLIVIGALMATVLGGVTLLNHIYNLNHIKSKTVPPIDLICKNHRQNIDGDFPNIYLKEGA